MGVSPHRPLCNPFGGPGEQHTLKSDAPSLGPLPTYSDLTLRVFFETDGGRERRAGLRGEARVTIGRQWGHPHAAWQWGYVLTPQTAEMHWALGPLRGVWGCGKVTV